MHTFQNDVTTIKIKAMPKLKLSSRNNGMQQAPHSQDPNQ